MTKTIQAISWKTAIYITDKNLQIQKPKTEDNVNLILSILDGLNNLYEKLNRLNYLIQRRKIKQILYLNGKGENK
jgi:hypothetical protein